MLGRRVIANQNGITVPCGVDSVEPISGDHPTVRSAQYGRVKRMARLDGASRNKPLRCVFYVCERPLCSVVRPPRLSTRGLRFSLQLGRDRLMSDSSSSQNIYPPNSEMSTAPLPLAHGSRSRERFYQYTPLDCANGKVRWRIVRSCWTNFVKCHD